MGSIAAFFVFGLIWVQSAYASWSPEARKAVIRQAQLAPVAAFESGSHATVWGAVHSVSYRVRGWKKPTYEEFEVQIDRGGKVPAVQKLQFLKKNVIRKAPLMVVLPGLFGEPDGGLAGRWVARFHAMGYHVVTFGNPWSKSYLKVGPASAEPGSIEKEAEIMLEAVSKTLQRLRPYVQSVSVTGQSYGGLLAAAVYATQERQALASGKAGPITGAVNIFGPPLEMAVGLQRFDQLFREAWKYQDQKICDIDLMDELKLLLAVKKHGEGHPLPLGDSRCADFLIASRFHDGILEAAEVMNRRKNFKGKKVPERYLSSDFLKEFSPSNFKRLGNAPEASFEYWICETPAQSREKVRMLAAEDDFLHEGLTPSFKDIAQRGCKDGSPFVDSLFLPWGGHLGFEGQAWFKDFTMKFLSAP